MIESLPQKIVDNIIVFPNQNRVGPPVSVEELKTSLIASKTEVIEYFVTELTKELLRISSDHGYHINNIKDISYLILSLKAVFLRYEDIYHPLHEFIDDSVSDEDETEGLELTESIDDIE
tara:strand:+ start:89 stop:448 length:360 start_codon:yes stop_codon:yes gene_type:complete